MTAFLLDTDIASAMIREPRGRAAQLAARAGWQRLALSVITAGELRFGIARSGRSLLARQVEELLGRLPVLSLDPAAATHYGEIRTHLQKRGRPIGANDLWLAAHALALNRILVTANRQEFERVPGLRVENWLE